MGSISSTQTGPRYQNLYATDLFFPNRHPHLSLYQVLSRQSICILCSVYTHCAKKWFIRARRRCGDPFEATVIQTGSISSTQTGPRYQNLYAADLFFPNRHAHLSLYQVLSRQSICILCSVYISYSRIIIVIR